MPLLKIDIEARYAQFQDALNAIQRDTKKAAGSMSRDFGSLKGALAGVGAAVSVGGIAAMVKANIDAADSLRDLSQETGVAVETLGGLGFAASQAGGNLESIADAAGKLNKSISGAAGGNKQFGDAFKALNIEIKNANGTLKTADQVLVEIADKFAGYADGPEKAALATRLLGKAGAEQISLLNEGGRALQQNIEFYKRYGGVTQETSDKADAFNDTLGKLNLIGGSFGRTLAAELLPALQAVAEALLRAKENGDGFESWAQRAGGVIKGLTGLAVSGAYAFEQYGIKLGAVAAKATALSKGDFKSIKLIGEGETEDLDKAREAYDRLSGEIKNGPKVDAVEGFIGKYAKKVQEEKELFTTRNEFLERYRKDDQISQKAYNEAKAANEKELIANTKVFYSAQIAGLTAQKVALQKEGKATADVQAQIDDLYKKRSLAGKDKPRAPVLAAEGTDASGKILDGQLRALERQSDEEQRLLASRSEFLQSYYQQDLVSANDYYNGLRASQQESLKARSDIIQKEIELIRASSPKDAQDAAAKEGKIAELLDRQKALEKETGLAGIKSFIEQDRAAKEFANTLAGINADLLEQQGLLPQAAGIRFDLGTERVRTRIDTARSTAVADKDPAAVAAADAALAQLDALRGLTVAQARLNTLGDIGARVQGTLTEATERAQIATQHGNVTELEGLRLVSDARLQAVADLQQVATAYETVARSSGDPRIIQQARALQLEVDKLAASADLVRDKFEDAFSGPFESALDKMISGTASLKDVLKSLFSDITKELAKISTQDFTSGLFKKDGALGGVVNLVSQAFAPSPGASNVTPNANVSRSIANAVGGGAEAAASAAMTTLATSTLSADGAMLALGVTTPIVDGAFATLAASAGYAAIALDAAAASAAGNSGGEALTMFSSIFAGGGFAKGAAFHAGAIVPFAKGGVKGIVDAPTMFQMSGGRTGLMGEAGPEAIMPLTRGRDGLSITMVDVDGNTSLLPVTRDGTGRMAVRGKPQAFANGGVFSGGSLMTAANTVHGARAEMMQRAGSGEKPMQVVQHFAISGPTNQASQGQISAAAARGLDQARRNR
jgi:hypothetical protein